MWTLVSGCYSEYFAKREIGVLLVGLEGSGKTTLLEKLKSIYGGVKGLPPDKIQPTVGCNVGKLSFSHYKVLIWDLGGRSSLRSIWDKYYSDTKAVIYCVDSTDPVHWEESRNVLKDVLMSVPGVPVLIFASKTDSTGSKSKEEMSSFFDVKGMGDGFAERVGIFEASFIEEGNGISDGIAWFEKKLDDLLYY